MENTQKDYTYTSFHKPTGNKEDYNSWLDSCFSEAEVDLLVSGDGQYEIYGYKNEVAAVG